MRTHKELKNGEHPIALRVTFNRKSKYYTLKDESKTISAEESNWDQLSGRFLKNKKGNLILLNYESRANDTLKSLDGKGFSFTKFEAGLATKRKRINIENYFEDIISELTQNNRLGSVRTYTDTQRRLNEFNGNSKIEFQDIDSGFIKKFERHLLNKGNSVNTVGIYLRTLRAIINRAIADGFLERTDYPFTGFTIKSGPGKKRTLSKESMKNLLNYVAEPGSRLEKSVSYFCFSYLSRGMNMQDMARLSWKKSINSDRIEYVRRKTANSKSKSETISIKIEPLINQILERFDKRTHYIFPILEKGLSASAERYRIKATLKRLSKDITAIANELDIPEAEDITFYWARHTFATVLKRSGVSTGIISEALGHSSEKTTQAYLDSFDTETLDATFDHLV